jgi:hypothetical protein
VSQPEEWSVAEHLAALASRTALDHDRVAGVLARRCWPGGAGDRMERAALDWVRRWGPHRVNELAPACGCASGRCTVCN